MDHCKPSGPEVLSVCFLSCKPLGWSIWPCLNFGPTLKDLESNLNRTQKLASLSLIECCNLLPLQINRSDVRKRSGQMFPVHYLNPSISFLDSL